MLCFGHRDCSGIEVGLNAAFLVYVHEIDLTRADSFNFYESFHFTFVFELEWESDFQVTGKSDSECCTLVVLNSGFKLGVGVGTPRAHTPY